MSEIQNRLDFQRHGESSPLPLDSDADNKIPKDPLAESLPPRYAIESDDEDEFNPLNYDSRPPANPENQVNITGNIPTNVNLIVASGIAGKAWARGANLKEQSGIVSVNGVKVCFDPPMSKPIYVI